MTVVARLEAVLHAQTEQFDRAMTTSETKMHKVGKVAGVAGLAIAGGLAYGLDKSVKAAMEAQTSTARLEQAFSRAGLQAGKYAKQVSTLESSGRKLGFTDEQTKEALGSLLTATHNMTTASKDLSIAQDIARFKHIDLISATKMLTMAQAGSQRATKQLGISVQAVTTQQDAVKTAYQQLTPAQKKATEATYKHDLATAKLIDHQKTANLVIQTVRDRLKGQADAYSQTAAGGMEQFKAQLNHLEVSMGTGLLPILGTVATALSGLVDWFSRNHAVAKALVIGLGILAGTLLTISAATKVYAAATKIAMAATKLYTAGVWLLNVALDANPIGLVIIALAALGVAFYEAYKHIKFFRDGVNAAFDWIKNNWPLLLGILTGPIGLAVVEIIKHKDTIVNVFKKLPGQIGNAITGAIGDLKTAIMSAFDWHKLLKWVEDAIDFHSPAPWAVQVGKNIVSSIAHGVGGSAGVLKNAVVKMAKHAITSIPHAVGGLLHGGAATGSQQNRNIGKQMAAKYGWGSGAQWVNLDALWQQESGWSNTAKNPSSGAYGIPQALPPTKLPFAGQEGGGSSAVAQIGWGLNYIKGRYGSPIAAEAHEQSFGWYDKGGWLPTGLSLAMNNTGRPERVVPPGGDNVVIPISIGGEHVATVIFDQLRRKAKVFENRNGRPAFGGA